MPYITPTDIPEGDDCRPLFIPKSSEWLAIVSGALTELTKDWNWEQTEGISVADAVARSKLIVESYYNTICCATPEGQAIMRLGSGGHIEQLVNGEWVGPEGDYELPPTPAREEPTEQDRLCAASANAAAVFEQFYENVSDSFNESLTTAQAAAALATLVASLLGSTGFGLALSALIEIGVLVFGVFYSITEFITADLWTEDFTEKFMCVLLDCASEDGDVVHFDYDCVLATLADATGLTANFEEVRLFGQIAYLLNWVGSQGLDAAGATTSVVDANCDVCTGCHTWEGSDLEEWEFFCCFASGGDRGHYATGELFSDNGTETGGAPNSTEIMTRILFPAPATITSITIQFGKTLGSFEGALGAVGDQIIIDSANGWYNGTAIDNVTPAQSSPWVWTGSELVTDELTLWMFAALWSNAGIPSGVFGDIDIFSIVICFEGDDPFV